MLNLSIVNSEEFTNGADLFNDIDAVPGAVNTATDECIDFESQLDNVVLNDWPEDEDDGGGSEDDGENNPETEDNGEDDGSETEGEGDGVLEAMVIDAKAGEIVIDVTADEMDVDGRVEAPGPSLDIAAPFQAGCVWTRQNWSCAYDVVFMVFFSIYQQSPPSWRRDWRWQSPDWTVQLADHFDLLIEALNSPERSPRALSTLFSSLRDQLRDKLSKFEPERFPRTGPIPASACRILEILFGSIHGPGIDQRLSCNNCGTTSQTSHHFPLLALPVFRRDYRRKSDPRFVSSETLVTRFIESLATPPSSPPCGSCHGTTQARTLSMANFPWIWFEVKGDNTMSPSPAVLIKLSDQRLAYDLHSIIYLGGDHFTARIQDPASRWWSYDGMWRNGAAQRDRVQITTDLLHNGHRPAALLVYRRRDT